MATLGPFAPGVAGVKKGQSMKHTLAALLVLFALPPGGGVRAAPDDEARGAITALANQVLDAFNKGDLATVKSLMPAESIIDDAPPFIWQGPGAFDAWLAAIHEDDARLRITDASSVFDPPTYIRVEGDLAYAVLPDHYRYKRDGVQVNEDATFTLVARKTSAGWRIIATTYSAAAH